ncbi:MAG: phosphoribosylformylglycinamidine cyclo-ligase [Deltaproteobacteria bacterium]|nr:phosphoribosylformylglycinamidine cyclo-ligase [Deltaproteobacteria bacterium]
MGSSQSLKYDSVGVQTLQVEGGLSDLAHWITRTFEFNAAKPQLPLGYFANVLRLTPDLGLAISTDGVGTKLLVAQELEKYDTVGIDCVAMNANDILCVGARPVSLVDYIAVQQADAKFLGELAKGFYEGARLAGINIPGGEVAQVREMLHGARAGYAFDLVGTCVGTVHPERVLVGQDVRPGDVVVGIASSGIHSNGFTLARRVLFNQAGLSVNERIPELARSVGEELLVPTQLYVREVVQMLDEGLALKAMMHVTGDGFLNLTRVEAPVGFVIDKLLDIPAIFSVIQTRGQLDDAEMFRVYNMGVGFCVVVEPKDAARVQAIARAHGKANAVIGYAASDRDRRVWITPRQLVSQAGRFVPARAAAPACPAR